MKRLPFGGSRILLAGAIATILMLPVAAPAGQFSQRGQRRRDTSLEDAMRIPQEELQLFGATVARVRVDVIVTDGDGNFVGDLTAEDFAIFEDGEAQEILDLQLVDLAAGEVHPLFGDAAPVAVRTTREVDTPPDTTAVPATPTPATAADTPAPSAASQLGAVIFLVDGPSLSPQTRARFGEAWIGMLDDTNDLQVPRAAYLVDNVGRVRELAPLGYDLEAMRAAADTVRGR